MTVEIRETNGDVVVEVEITLYVATRSYYEESRANKAALAKA